MFRIPSPRRAALVGVLGMALLAAACSGNDTGTSASQAPPPRPRPPRR
jgi:ABC-type glycerol-3-phosphate transport system substrate-binding protein